MGSGEIPATLNDYDDEWEDIPADYEDISEGISAVEMDENEAAINKDSLICPIFTV